ncbi:MAG: hypothetical protein K9I94_04670 [Bacteroidales bacterium]|nr:hypothetical protein [Bacteroidales bacterium]
MKTLALSMIVLLASMLGIAQSENYEKAMMANIETMNQAGEAEQMMEVANKFERIANAEEDQWHPWYYAAYCAAVSTYMGVEKENIDQRLDQAQSFLDKAFKLENDNDELYVLQGFIHQARIQVNPDERGYPYSMKSNKAFNEAKQINPDNPRLYYLLGQNTLNTPEAFGGGKEPACKQFKEAAEKFAAHKSGSPLAPTWGKRMTKELLKMCEN